MCIRFLCVLLLRSFCVLSQVGVNLINPHPSSALQIESPSGTAKGLLTPSVTTTNRMAMTSGTNVAADGLVVYDVNHRMHYYYHGLTNRWMSMSPLALSTPTSGGNGYPSGVITTPVTSVSTTFSLGINRSNPVRELDVAGSASVSGNFSSGGSIATGGSLSVAGYAVNALVPSGAIIMWSGSALPAGWVDCDGSNGTPDLRGRFIVATGQASSLSGGDLSPTYALHNTGGENRHILTTAEIPKHTHLAKGDNSTISIYGGAHSHYANPSGQGLDAKRSGGNAGGLASDGVQTITTTTESHSHPVSEFSGHVGDGTTSGLNNQPHENRPPFYALRFIMKL